MYCYYYPLTRSFTLSGKWSSPTVGGTRPPPCSYFTLTMIDDHHAVLFGGYQFGRGMTNDAYILDLIRMVSCVYYGHAYNNDRNSPFSTIVGC